jgi:rhamnulokinase
VGNFAVQLAVLEGYRDPVHGADAERVTYWAGRVGGGGSVAAV